MRKDELLYLHHLLALVREEVTEQGGAPAGAFASYEEVDVGPMAIYAAKSEHERAVRALATTLAAVAAGDTERAVPSP
jgi:hypothetical protein